MMKWNFFRNKYWEKYYKYDYKELFEIASEAVSSQNHLANKNVKKIKTNSFNSNTNNVNSLH